MNPEINQNNNLNNNNFNNNNFNNNIINNINNNINNNNNINLQNNNNNNNNNMRANNTERVVFLIILFLAIIITFVNIYSFFHITNMIKKAYAILPINVFEECYLYQKIFDLFVDFLSFFLGVDLIFLIFLPYIDNFFNLDIFLSKFGKTFFYFNYLVFGPFLIGCLLVSLKYNNKLMYICVNFDPANKIFNYRLSFVYLFCLTLSLIISFLGSYMVEDSYFSDSIKCKPSGNYIITNLFWFLALRRSRIFPNERNNNLNEGILDNEEINQGN